jgi:hypothetical protein
MPLSPLLKPSAAAAALSSFFGGFTSSGEEKETEVLEHHDGSPLAPLSQPTDFKSQLDMLSQPKDFKSQRDMIDAFHRAKNAADNPF